MRKNRGYKYLSIPKKSVLSVRKPQIPTFSNLVKFNKFTPKSTPLRKPTRSKLYSNLNTYKPDCIKRIKNADASRRRSFFKSKARGNTSQRPEHQRKHQRTC